MAAEGLLARHILFPQGSSRASEQLTRPPAEENRMRPLLGQSDEALPRGLSNEGLADRGLPRCRPLPSPSASLESSPRPSATLESSPRPSRALDSAPALLTRRMAVPRIPPSMVIWVMVVSVTLPLPPYRPADCAATSPLPRTPPPRSDTTSLTSSRNSKTRSNFRPQQPSPTHPNPRSEPALSCLRTSVTNLYPDIGDASGALGGDTSSARRARHVLPDPRSVH